MGIRGKTIILLSTLFTVAVLLFVVLAQTLLLRGFVNVETAAMQRDVQRVIDAVKYDLHTINAKGTDWTYWDDTYQFVQDKNQQYIDDNLVSSIGGQAIDYWIFFDKKHRLVYSVGYDSETFEPLTLPPSLKSFLTPDNALLKLGDNDSREVVLNLADGPMMVVSRPVLRSDKSGPAAGTVVWATPINAKRIKTLSETTHLNFSLYSAGADNLPSDVRSYIETPARSVDRHTILPVSEQVVAGYATLRDGFGGPDLILRVEEPRSIYHEGKQTLNYVVLGLILLMVVMMFVLGVLLNRFVVDPVADLASMVRRVREHNRHALDPKILARKDEIGHLAGSIDEMISNLDHAHKALEDEKAAVEAKVIERTRDLQDAQLELQTVHAELAASVRSLPFGFALVNQDNRLIFANGMLDVGQKPANSFEVLAQRFSAAIDMSACVKLATTKRKPVERSFALESRYYRFVFSPVVDQASASGAAVGTVIVMEDITEEKATQRARDEFFSIASHELRTPLTAIRGNSQMIMEYYANEITSADHKDMMHDIHSASVRLIHIVNDFLDSSRLEMNKMEFKLERVDLVALAHGVVREYDVTGSRRKIKIHVESQPSTPEATADPDRVRQILVNLVGNALRYTVEGSITISIAPNKKRVAIRVTDTGKGIPIAMQHLLFRKFQQAGTSIHTRDSTNSTGLGLYISRLLAKGMNGSVTLESSTPGKGSTFVIDLPAALEPKS